MTEQENDNFLLDKAKEDSYNLLSTSCDWLLEGESNEADRTAQENNRKCGYKRV